MAPLSPPICCNDMYLEGVLRGKEELSDEDGWCIAFLMDGHWCGVDIICLIYSNHEPLDLIVDYTRFLLLSGVPGHIDWVCPNGCMYVWMSAWVYAWMLQLLTKLQCLHSLTHCAHKYSIPNYSHWKSVLPASCQSRDSVGALHCVSPLLSIYLNTKCGVDMVTHQNVQNNWICCYMHNFKFCRFQDIEEQQWSCVYDGTYVRTHNVCFKWHSYRCVP